MKYTITQTHRQQSNSLIRTMRKDKGLILQDAFSESEFNLFIDNHIPEYRERIYTPTTTLLAFMTQTMCADHSCQHTVARINALLNY